MTYIITQTAQNKRNNEKTEKETSFWLIRFVGNLQKQIITHKFLETFNRNTFKLSYSCKQNLNILMTSHNKKATSYSKTNIILNIRPVSIYPKNLQKSYNVLQKVCYITLQSRKLRIKEENYTKLEKVICGRPLNKPQIVFQY